jgi:hypothetical protein
LGAALSLLDRIDQAEAKLVRGERLAPGDDLLVTEAVRLQGAFVTLARAARDARAGNASSAARGWKSVRQQIERVRQLNRAGQSLSDQSDDLRSTLRILDAELERSAKT